MSGHFQQQALLRKFIYMGVIIVLFASARVLQHFVVEKQAKEMGLREQDRGQVHLSESALSLMLFSFRGLAVCALWLEADEYQKRNQLSELDICVSALTKLQAHHIDPWLFHSWNLDTNVAGQCDRIQDKYYFISRGMTVLAQGERRNENNPRLRWEMGYKYRQRICDIDERNVMRSLFQLSCIPPEERDLRRLQTWDANRRRWVVDETKFKEFCRKHPTLIRRLHEPPMRYRRPSEVFICRTPEDVIHFLAQYQEIPSRYKDSRESGSAASTLKDPEERFPILPPRREPPPPQHLFDKDELTSSSVLDDDFDGYAAARAWFGYAQEPVPDPGSQSWFDYARNPNPDDSMLPGYSKPIENRRLQRKPKFTTVIFRSHPALAQEALAERLEEEGWFDESWKIPDWFRGEAGPGSAEPIQVGGARNRAGEAWRAALYMWEKMGRANGLLLDREELADLKTKAAAYQEGRTPPGSLDYKAHRYLEELESYRKLTGFNQHYYRARMESEPEAVTARKHFYKAERLVLGARSDAAIREYARPDALLAWKSLWKRHLKDYPDMAKEFAIQDPAAELQYGYVKLLQESTQVKNLLVFQHFLAQALTAPPEVAGWVRLGRPSDRMLPPLEIKGPFDDIDDQGRPLIPEDVKMSIRVRKGEIIGKLPAPPGAEPPPVPPARPR